MALPDLTGQNIQDTYQRVLQTDSVNILDGTGSIFIPPSASYAETASHALYAVSASHEITYELSSSYAETASYANDFKISGSLDVDDSLNVGPTGSLTVTGSINLVGYNADAGAKSDIIFSVDAARTANRFYVNNDGGFRASSTSYHFQYFPSNESTGQFSGRFSTSKYTTFDRNGFAFGSVETSNFVDGTSMVHIKGDNDPTKYALKIEDYNDTELLTVKNDGTVNITGSLTLTGSFNALLPTSSTDTYFVTYNTASYELEARQVATLINPKVEYLDVTASISSGTSITLPNGLSYISSSTYEYLEVFFNGLRLRYDRDFVPTSTTTIQNQITFPSGSELTFKSLKA